LTFPISSFVKNNAEVFGFVDDILGHAGDGKGRRVGSTKRRKNDYFTLLGVDVQAEACEKVTGQVNEPLQSVTCRG
jgi:hypothetical protein